MPLALLVQMRIVVTRKWTCEVSELVAYCHPGQCSGFRHPMGWVCQSNSYTLTLWPLEPQIAENVSVCPVPSIQHSFVDVWSSVATGVAQHPVAELATLAAADTDEAKLRSWSILTIPGILQTPDMGDQSVKAS